MSVFNKLKEVKDLRSQAKTLQNALAREHVEGTAAWGKIKIAMNGNQEIEKVDIDSELLNPEKKKIIEDGIKEAVADAIKKVQKIMAEKMRSGDIKMPNF